MSLSMSLGTKKRRDKGPCLSAALGHHIVNYTPTESCNMNDEFDLEDFDIEIETNAPPGVTVGLEDTPVSVSERAKFWEEFKTITRTYQETDEVALLMANCSKAQLMEYMFYYFSAVVGLSASTNTMSTAQLHEHFSLNATSILRTLPNQARFLNGIFASITGNTWPDGFVEYITAMQDEYPSNAWIKSNRVRLTTPDKIKVLYFGSRVTKAWEETKRCINNVLNPIYKRVPTPIPSGLQRADVMYWTRTQAWESEAIERAKAAVRRQFSRDQEGREDPQKFQLTEHMEEVHRKSKEMGFKENWFPKCWLVFVFHGLPAPPEERAVQLLSGMTTDTPKRRYEEVSANSSAANRRLARELDADGSCGGSTGDRNSKRQRGDDRIIQHNVYVHESSDTLLDRRIHTSMARLELLTKMYPDDHERVRVAREELLQLYDQVLS